MTFPRKTALLAALLLSLAAAPSVHAHDYTQGDIHIDHPWARAGLGNAGAFFTLSNRGGEADTLLKAEGDVADKVELHTHIHDNGVMRMRAVESIDVPAGGTVRFEPGGLHVMLIGLKGPLKEGHRFPLTLTFKRAGTVVVTVNVQAAGAMQGAAPGAVPH